MSSPGGWEEDVASGSAHICAGHHPLPVLAINVSCSDIASVLSLSACCIYNCRNAACMQAELVAAQMCALLICQTLARRGVEYTRLSSFGPISLCSMSP